jgi:hypothetical protein
MARVHPLLEGGERGVVRLGWRRPLGPGQTVILGGLGDALRLAEGLDLVLGGAVRQGRHLTAAPDAVLGREQCICNGVGRCVALKALQPGRIAARETVAPVFAPRWRIAIIAVIEVEIVVGGRSGRFRHAAVRAAVADAGALCRRCAGRRRANGRCWASAGLGASLCGLHKSLVG